MATELNIDNLKSSLMWFDYFSRAFVDQFPVFMVVITISGLVGVFQTVRIATGYRSTTNRGSILSAGLFALFVGLLVFPVEVFQLIQTINLAGENSPSIVPGGLYITFVPMLYGLFWFLISFLGWLYCRREINTPKSRGVEYQSDFDASRRPE